MPVTPSQLTHLHRDVDAIVLVFSFDSRTSLEDTKTQLSNISALETRPKVIAVLGNQCDIRMAARDVAKSDVDSLLALGDFTYYEGTAIQNSPTAESSLYLIDYIVRSIRNSIQQPVENREDGFMSCLPVFCYSTAIPVRKILSGLKAYIRNATRW